MAKNVSEIMTVEIETIGLEDTAQTAAKKMKEKNVSSLVVMDVNNKQSVLLPNETSSHKYVIMR